MIADVPSERAVAQRTLRPLTEHLLERVSGDHWLLVAAWALVPWVNGGLNLLLDTETESAVWEQSSELVVLNYAALSFAIVLSVWGSRRIARRMEDLRGAEPFRELNSRLVPLIGAIATACAFGVTAFVEDGVAAALLRGVTWFIVGVPLWTFLWTYVVLQLGLYRVGAQPVADAARMDPGLGLRPLGDLAFTGLWILLAWLVPLVYTGLTDIVGVVLGLSLLALALATFFLSLVRLHHRMVEVKAEELALARDLYGKAYEPVRLEPTLDVLEAQRSLLGAADGLEQRAKAIHDWPIDEATFARVVTIATSVVAIAIGRLLLDPFGL